MSINDYTNKEVFEKCLVTFVSLCIAYGLEGNVNHSLLDEFRFLKDEVLERMER